MTMIPKIMCTQRTMDFPKTVRKSFTECATTPLINGPKHQQKARAREKEQPTGGLPERQGEILLDRDHGADHVGDH